jgi:methionyl-tRNA synthetase
MSKSVLVAPAWPYANGPRHVGHVAGFAVPSDIFARYHRLKGDRVLMVSGSDEHGTPITVAADKEGITARQLADRYNAVIRDDLRALGMSYDWFTRTTTPNHRAVVQDIFGQLLDAGYIFRRVALGAFSETTGATLPDRYIEGTCPICGYDRARGDQCENCGSQLDPIDLVDPLSTVDGRPPAFRESEHFFLDLPAFAEQLTEWIARQHHWRSNVRASSLELSKELKARAITREMEWGVPIPLPEFEGRHDRVIYVWFDAVIGYLSASIEWAAAQDEPELWRTWWLDPSSESSYFMGKDNIVFHTVIWPAILTGYGEATGEEYQLPWNVVSSEFLTMEGRKFSSSRGVVIYVRDILERFEPDALRFYLAVAGPETQDSDFTYSEFARRTNDVLIAKWGNLVQRTLTIVSRSFGTVPEPQDADAAGRQVLETVHEAFGTVGELIERARFKSAVEELMKAVDAVNAYFTREEPWRLVQVDPTRAQGVLFVALQAISDLGVMFAPFLPFSSQRLHDMLGFDGLVTDLADESERPDGHVVLTRRDVPLAVGWGRRELRPGARLEAPTPLFRRIEDSDVERELSRLAGAG